MDTPPPPPPDRGPKWGTSPYGHPPPRYWDHSLTKGGVNFIVNTYDMYRQRDKQIDRDCLKDG